MSAPSRVTSMDFTKRPAVMTTLQHLIGSISIYGDIMKNLALTALTFVVLSIMAGCTLPPRPPESPLPTPALIEAEQVEATPIPPTRIIWGMDDGEADFVAFGNEILTAEGQEFGVYWTVPNIDVSPLVLMSGQLPVIGEYVFDLELRPVGGGDVLTKTMSIDYEAQTVAGDGLAVSVYTTWTTAGPGDYELWKKVTLILHGSEMAIVDIDTGESTPIENGHMVYPVILDSSGNIAELDANGFAFDSMVNVPYRIYFPVIFR